MCEKYDSNCPDCGVGIGEPHARECDVERCSHCGTQRITCGCKDHEPWKSVWMGRWPSGKGYPESEKRERKTKERYWWIAVNGASAALSPMPLAEGDFTVMPRPAGLTRFAKRDEAVEAQTFLLTANASEVHARVERWKKEGRVTLIPNPEPPGKETFWVV